MNAVRKLVQSIKCLLGIHSPEKVVIPIGNDKTSGVLAVCPKCRKPLEVLWKIC